MRSKSGKLKRPELDRLVEVVLAGGTVEQIMLEFGLQARGAATRWINRIQAGYRPGEQLCTVCRVAQPASGQSCCAKCRYRREHPMCARCNERARAYKEAHCRPCEAELAAQPPAARRATVRPRFASQGHAALAVGSGRPVWG